MESIHVSIVPAAGRSVRMEGHNKLLLPWKRNSTMIDEVLQAWTESKITRIVVVTRADDIELHQVCEKWPRVELVRSLNDPRDMKESIRYGLEFLNSHDRVCEIDRWFVAPADIPTLNARIIDHLIDASSHRDEIVIPRFDGRRGHPISLPWSLASQVYSLSENEGINRLLRDNPVEYFDLRNEICPEDIDTHQEYLRRWTQF